MPLPVHLFDMIRTLSSALDLLNPDLGLHQKRTCLIAAQLARHLGIEGADYLQLFGAAIFHDIGSISVLDRLSLPHCDESDHGQHGWLSALILSRFPLFAAYGSLVRLHHVEWQDGAGQQHAGEPVPILVHLLHLADQIALQMCADQHVLALVPHIQTFVQQHRGSRFHPEFADAFLQLSQRESFWMDTFNAQPDAKLALLAPFEKIELHLDNMLSFARFVALLIDSRSHFTATHSAGVAVTAEVIAGHLGMSRLECAKIRMAGYLHDLGKLAIPKEFVERQGELAAAEMAQIRAHSYWTFEILSSLRGLEDVALWAGLHHERLDGSGYPFHKKGDELPLGARILAVSDVYTALTEDRPYRPGLPRDQVLALMQEQVEQIKLDPVVFAVLVQHIEQIETVCCHAQLMEGLELEEFWRAGGLALLA